MKIGQTSWRIVTMLFATATAGYICRVNVATAGPLLMNEFGLSQVAMGRVFSAFLLGYALFQVPTGALSDRWGARRILALAGWLWVVFTILQTLVGLGIVQTTAFSALTAFLVCRFMLGISAAPTYPGSAQGISRWIMPKFQGRANAIVITSVGLGSALAPPLVANVMVHFGWRIALLVSAIPALAIALIWMKIKEPQIINLENENIETYSDSLLQNKKNGLRSGSFILLTISYSLQGYVGYIFINWFYIYLVQERHFGLLSGAWMSSLPWVLSIISIPLGGYISDRLVLGKLGQIWGRRLIPIIGMAASGILISLGAHTQNAIMAAISLAFATACVLCVEGPFWASMIRIAGPKSGTGGGIMNMGCNIGGLISPALTPLLATFIGWENALHVAAVLAIIAALLWFWIKPNMQNS
jgi:ACS family glucarate transporter-like MFS transporter